MKLKDHYDIIIVGGGPAGTTTARFAAENGAEDVLVVDRNDELGTPKRCGEGLTTDIFEDFDIPAEKGIVNQKIESQEIFAPNGKSVHVEIEEIQGYILERKKFDKYLAERAIEEGASVISGTEAELVDNHIVRLKGPMGTKEIEAEIVVGADGVESGIAQQAGIDSTNEPKDLDSGYQYELAGIEIDDPSKIYVYVGNDLAPRGYIWIFPKGDSVANVGCGITGEADKSAKHYLDKFIAKREELAKGSILEVNVGAIPVGGFLENLVKDNVMIVGDAARQVNPIHGGGIKEVMYAGRIAGRKAAKAVKSDESERDEILDEYEEEWAEEQEKLNKVLKVRYFSENLDDEDYNYLADVWDGDDLVDLTRGNYGTVFKKLIRHPKLFKYVKNFI